MVTFRNRLCIYSAFWLLTGFALAYMPHVSDESLMEWQEWFETILVTPFVVALGLTVLFPPYQFIFVAVSVYLVGHAVVTLTQKQCLPFFGLCAVHLLQITVAIVSYLRFTSSLNGGG